VSDPGSAARRSLLVVDDDDDVCTAVARIFEARGWLVHRTRTGPDAIALLRGDLPLDAALVDLVLPGIGGLDVVRAIRARHAACRIVGLTAMTESAIVRAFNQAGADGFVGKPFELNVIVAAVEGP